jgi:hypothetical protein
METIPGAIPVTTPVLLIVAMLRSPLVQTPPALASASVITPPTITVKGPVIGANGAKTTIGAVTKQPPGMV